MVFDFTVVLRGYERTQVDKVLNPALEALDSTDAWRRAAARDSLRDSAFDTVLRGYDRAQVDAAIDALRQALDSPVPGDDFRSTLGSVLRILQPTDQLIIDEVRRLRELADRHHL
ncbi:DivIVA domain-containing protein [Actinoplanes sp. TBRC 11911]|uniref:DivIVA domain-containing protein n=1 Tax=Actinoplanes sp. TBRC 11911 TaxID=2729386 RepID=UPI00145D708B|nr:DivIVA domain-containing protein [Actinoplanes sp. TBRC 11911]NMO49957.1 DivIVA domain-containing protein [Actinoplanes sp. TBRC 11911]